MKEDVAIDLIDAAELLKRKPSKWIIGPELAKQLLALSKGNRQLSKQRIFLYARDMKSGNWPLGDQPIGLHCDGWLANGHHRLSAIIIAKVSVRFRLIFDLTDDDVRIIDQGRPRRVADHVTIMGGKNANLLVACARHLAIFARRDFSTSISVNEFEQIISAHPNIHESAALCHNIRNVGSPSAVAAIHYIGKYYQQEDTAADEFIGVLKNGAPAYTNDPAHLVRERIIKETTRHMKLHGSARIALLLHAWSLFRKRQSVSKLMIPNELPHIAGWDESVLRRGFD